MPFGPAIEFITQRFGFAAIVERLTDPIVQFLALEFFEFHDRFVKPFNRLGGHCPSIPEPQLAFRAAAGVRARREANAALPRALRSSSFLLPAARSSGVLIGDILSGSSEFVV